MAKFVITLALVAAIVTPGYSYGGYSGYRRFHEEHEEEKHDLHELKHNHPGGKHDHLEEIHDHENNIHKSHVHEQKPAENQVQEEQQAIAQIFVSQKEKTQVVGQATQNGFIRSQSGFSEEASLSTQKDTQGSQANFGSSQSGFASTQIPDHDHGQGHIHESLKVNEQKPVENQKVQEEQQIIAQIFGGQKEETGLVAQATQSSFTKSQSGLSEEASLNIQKGAQSSQGYFGSSLSGFASTQIHDHGHGHIHESLNVNEQKPVENQKVPKEQQPIGQLFGGKKEKAQVVAQAPQSSFIKSQSGFSQEASLSTQKGAQHTQANFGSSQSRFTRPKINNHGHVLESLKVNEQKPTENQKFQEQQHPVAQISGGQREKTQVVTQATQSGFTKSQSGFSEEASLSSQKGAQSTQANFGSSQSRFTRPKINNHGHVLESLKVNEQKPIENQKVQEQQHPVAQISGGQKQKTQVVAQATQSGFTKSQSGFSEEASLSTQKGAQTTQANIGSSQSRFTRPQIHNHGHIHESLKGHEQKPVENQKVHEEQQATAQIFVGQKEKTQVVAQATQSGFIKSESGFSEEASLSTQNSAQNSQANFGSSQSGFASTQIHNHGHGHIHESLKGHEQKPVENQKVHEEQQATAQIFVGQKEKTQVAQATQSGFIKSESGFSEEASLSTQKSTQNSQANFGSSHSGFASTQIHDHDHGHIQESHKVHEQKPVENQKVQEEQQTIAQITGGQNGKTQVVAQATQSGFTKSQSGFSEESSLNTQKGAQSTQAKFGSSQRRFARPQIHNHGHSHTHESLKVHVQKPVETQKVHEEQQATAQIFVGQKEKTQVVAQATQSGFIKSESGFSEESSLSTQKSAQSSQANFGSSQSGFASSQIHDHDRGHIQESHKVHEQKPVENQKVQEEQQTIAQITDGEKEKTPVVAQATQSGFTKNQIGFSEETSLNTQKGAQSTQANFESSQSRFTRPQIHNHGHLLESLKVHEQKPVENQKVQEEQQTIAQITGGQNEKTQVVAQATQSGFTKSQSGFSEEASLSTQKGAQSTQANFGSSQSGFASTQIHDHDHGHIQESHKVHEQKPVENQKVQTIAQITDDQKEKTPVIAQATQSGFIKSQIGFSEETSLSTQKGAQSTQANFESSQSKFTRPQIHNHGHLLESLKVHEQNPVENQKVQEEQQTIAQITGGQNEKTQVVAQATQSGFTKSQSGFSEEASLSSQKGAQSTQANFGSSQSRFARPQVHNHGHGHIQESLKVHVQKPVENKKVHEEQQATAQIFISQKEETRMVAQATQSGFTKRQSGLSAEASLSTQEGALSTQAKFGSSHSGFARPQIHDHGHSYIHKGLTVHEQKPAENLKVQEEQQTIAQILVGQKEKTQVVPQATQSSFIMSHSGFSEETSLSTQKGAQSTQANFGSSQSRFTRPQIHNHGHILESLKVHEQKPVENQKVQEEQQVIAQIFGDQKEETRLVAQATESGFTKSQSGLSEESSLSMQKGAQSSQGNFGSSLSGFASTQIGFGSKSIGFSQGSSQTQTAAASLESHESHGGYGGYGHHHHGG